MSNSIKYTIEFSPKVEDQLNIIPKKVRKLIVERIKNLCDNPRPENIEPLKGIEKGFFRIRQGDYRIVYRIYDEKILVIIVRVVHRKEVYTKKHVCN